MARNKRFNVTGLCRPSLHYMVDTTGKIDTIIRDYIEPGEYFVINRARQYGKTTTLELLRERLSSQCLVILLSFEGGEGLFKSDDVFAYGLSSQLYRSLNDSHPELACVFTAEPEDQIPMFALGIRISNLCERSAKPVILIIDEVDRASDYAIFTSFLGLLRTKYLQRETPDSRTTFHNVILAGVHDIKNLKARIRPDSEHAYNSPWNIAAEFTVDMSFSAGEIDGMLRVYEADHHIGMDTYALAKVIREQTGGYPFLVSALCKRLDEVTHDWTVAGLHAAVAHLLSTTNTLFDDIIKNLQRHAEFRGIVESMLLYGMRKNYVPSDPGIALGEMFGVFKKVGIEVRVSNIIFEQYIYNHLLSISENKIGIPSDETRSSLYIKNGSLDMRLVLERFAGLMKAEYRAEYGRLIEKEWRLLFLIFLRPIINGTGTYAVEAETRSNTRMDLVVFYGNEEHIVELKIWHGQKKEKESYSQLTGYLDARGQRRGYLISFCNLKNPPSRGEWIECGDCMIYEEIVPYSSDVEG